jgi:hypothetical protein
MATVGEDCDITLTHPGVNGGSPVGFILKRARATVSGLVTLRRQAYTLPEGGYTDRVTWWMTILCSDDLNNPDGSRHERTREDIYADLLAFLAERTGITLTLYNGVYTDLHATLTVTTEYIGRLSDEVVLRLNNGAFTETVPIDRTRFYNSYWDGPLTWDSSYWR